MTGHSVFGVRQMFLTRSTMLMGCPSSTGFGPCRTDSTLVFGSPHEGNVVRAKACNGFVSSGIRADSAKLSASSSPEVAMGRFKSLAVGAAAAALLAAAPLGAQSSRPTVALMNFDYGTIEHWWSGNQDIGAGI